MISIVLYGRNDSYGYNLHKRAALGLNCMAHLLSEESDEILFVDYNTPDDYPTFPEAIADTLTAAAASRLRVLRVRPAIHDRWKAKTHLFALEPMARNVAVRRSNPANRWILSTNTDMIFVPRVASSLSEMASDLGPGFYHLPRFELPESLWEGFDRRDPAAVIGHVRRFGRTMFLNEIVYGADCIKYDAPGDFQLISRDDLFRINGFNEDMLLGWHVDSNIAKRLHLIYGVVGDLVERLFGYHCDHTRQVTPMHRHNARSNSTRVFIDEVTTPELPHQADTWGCAHDDIEEIRLSASASRVYVRTLSGVLEGEWTEPVEAHYIPETFGDTSYDPRHVLPFLADLFVSAPRHWTLGWIGGRADTFHGFREIWQRFGFAEGVLIDSWSLPLLAGPGPGVRAVDPHEIDASADVLIFDFGTASDSPNPLHHEPIDPARLDDVVERLVRDSFRQLVEAERARLRAGAAPRRFVCIDAVHNDYEALVRQEITAASTPFASRLRHGFVIPESLQDVWDRMPRQEFLDRLHVGSSGRRTGGVIAASAGERGYLFTGPDELLPPGDYEVAFALRPRTPMTLVSLIRPIVIEVVVGSECVEQRRVRSLFWTTEVMRFRVSYDCYLRRGLVEFRLLRGRSVDFAVTSVRVTQLAARTGGPEGPARQRLLLDLLAQPAPPGDGQPRRAREDAAQKAIASGTA